MIPLPKIRRPKQVRAYSIPHFDFRLAWAVSKVDRQQNVSMFSSFSKTPRIPRSMRQFTDEKIFEIELTSMVLQFDLV